MNGRSATPAGDDGGPGVSLLEVINVLLRHRKLILILPILLTLGLAVRASIDTEFTYTATTRFIPEDPRSETGNRTDQAVRALGGRSQSNDLYAALLTSRTLLNEVVQQEFTVNTDDGPIRASYIELHEIGGRSPESRVENAARHLRGNVNATTARDISGVQLSVTANQPELAEQVAQALLDLVHEFNLERRQSHAAAEARFVGERMAEADRELREAENQLQSFLRNNRQFRNSPELVFEHDRLQRAVSMRQELYTSLARAFDNARIEQTRNTALITVIEAPAGSARGNRASRLTVMVILGVVLGLVLGILIAFVLEFFRRTREQGLDDYKEFNRLKREAVDDLRRPIRMLGFRRSTTSRSSD